MKRYVLSIDVNENILRAMFDDDDTPVDELIERAINKKFFDENVTFKCIKAISVSRLKIR